MHTTPFHLMGDDALLAALGERLARHRLNRNQTQAAVAREAGVARRTVSKAENGRVIDTRGLLRILRALELLDRLDHLVPPPQVSPVALAENRGKVRVRASGQRSENPPAGEAAATEWTWPDRKS